jgi:hypothetical protein
MPIHCLLLEEEDLSEPCCVMALFFPGCLWIEQDDDHYQTNPNCNTETGLPPLIRPPPIQHTNAMHTLPGA